MDAIILCGGAGTRLWPLSRRETPKHFLALTGTEKALVRETYERLEPVAERIWPVAPPEQQAELRRLLPEIPEDRFVPEPAPRGTATAIGLAVERIASEYPEAVVGSFHADHLIPDPDGFTETVQRAERAAAELGRIVLLGITPRFPTPALGYIEAGGELASGVRTVETFKEKPDRETAKHYLEQGNYYWNAGMFIAPAQVFLGEYDAYLPGWREVFRQTLLGENQAYLDLDPEQIDYAIMEKTERLALIPADFEWTDIGVFEDLYDAAAKDAQGNVVRGEVVTQEAERNLLFSTGRVIAALGVEDLVVIETPEAVLVMPRERSAEVKTLVEQLPEDHR